MAAPSPAPPNMKSPPVQIPGVTGSFQRNRLCVGSSPRKVRVSIGAGSYGATRFRWSMGDAPWPGDACSLVDAFRRGERSPVEELEAMYAAIDASPLNAFSHLDRERATIAAGVADVSLPFGGVPIGVKELEAVAGWPFTRRRSHSPTASPPSTSTMVHRIRDRGGAVLAGQTTASEFGGVNLTRTILHGTTRNPWQLDRTPGGSSGGSAAAVAGGLLTLATAGDGGGSIRIPAGFCGLVGLKATFGRIPRSPEATYGNLTVDRRVRVALGARHGPLVRRRQRPRRPRSAEPPAGRPGGSRRSAR